jgi:glucosylceramidase
MKNNHWLHYWGIKSTSPFKQAVVFTTDTIGVTSVTVSPATATVSAGQDLELKATVVTTGFANKAVLWSVEEIAGVSITQAGKLKVASTVESGTEITVTATSVYDDTKYNTATITVA